MCFPLYRRRCRLLGRFAPCHWSLVKGKRIIAPEAKSIGRINKGICRPLPPQIARRSVLLRIGDGGDVLKNLRNVLRQAGTTRRAVNGVDTAYLLLLNCFS